MSYMAQYNNPSIMARYQAWDAANPTFYDRFKEYTLELINAGVTNFGVRLVWERLRWDSLLSTTGDEYKMNDHFHTIYARRFMDDHPQFGQLFRLRNK